MSEISAPLVTLIGPKLKGVRKYLGGAPDSARSAIYGVPAHSEQVLRLERAGLQMNRLLHTQRQLRWMAMGMYTLRMMTGCTYSQGMES